MWLTERMRLSAGDNFQVFGSAWQSLTMALFTALLPYLFSIFISQIRPGDLEQCILPPTAPPPPLAPPPPPHLPLQ